MLEICLAIMRHKFVIISWKNPGIRVEVRVNLDLMITLKRGMTIKSPTREHMRKEKIINLPFHILLLAIFPALALLVNNLGQTALWVVRRPLIVSVLIGLLFFLVAWLLIRQCQKASLWTAWALVMFFSYGHLYRIVEDFQLFGFLLGRHRYLVILWGVVFILGTWLILRKIQVSEEIIKVINFISLILVLFQIGQIVLYQYRKGVSQQQAQASLSDPFLSPGDPANMPDVYLIILDMYGREDALEEYYEYDNREFLSQLEEMGFYVADCGRSNYSNTALSLASQLNMEYIDVLLDDVNLEATSYLIKNSTVRMALEEIGYTTIAFETGVGWADPDEADIFYTRPPIEHVVTSLEPFEVMFVEGTIGWLFLDYYISLNLEEFKYVETPVEAKAQRTLMVLDYLRLLPAMEGPKFVHAHMIIPHPPHVFNLDGSVNLQAEQVEDKIGLSIQLDYLNPQILEIVEKIIDNSSPDPIVILEGDHGFGNLQRNSILNALYLPDGGVETLYPQISLVNTFRVMFNQYFGTNLSLLEDLSYKHIGDDSFEYAPQEEWNLACIP